MNHYDWFSIEINSIELGEDPEDNSLSGRKRIRLLREPSCTISALVMFEQEVHFTNGTIFAKHKVMEGVYHGSDYGTTASIYISIEGEKFRLSPDQLTINPLQAVPCIWCDIHYHEQDFTQIEVNEGDAHTYLAICNTCYKRNKSKVKAYNSTARKNGGATSLKVSQWLQKLLDSRGYCHYCKEFIGIPLLIMEHQKPLSLGGDNSIENVVPSCARCNSSKGNRDVATWQYYTKRRNLCELLQEHLGLSKFEVTNLAIKKLAIELGLLDESEVEM